MRAIAVVPSAKQVRLLRDVPRPEFTAPAQARLRMLEVGVCGTDKEICAFEYGTPPPGADHLIIGHESLGEVTEVSDGAAGLARGDLVVTMVRRPCPHAHCLPCRSGRPDFCSTGDFTERGIKQRHGFMAEEVVDDAVYMVPLPRALREVGVLVEPLTIAEKAIAQIALVQERLPWGGTGHAHTAVVLGAGPVGLLGAMALRAAGFRVVVYSLEKAPNPKAALVEAIGGEYVSSTTHDPAALGRSVGPVDVVFEATGASKLSFDVLPVLGTNGVFVFTGVPGRRGPISVDADRLMRDLVLKNQMVFGTVNAGRETFESAIRDLGIFMERWPDAVRALLTGRYAPDAYAQLLQGRPAGIKNVIAM